MDHAGEINLCYPRANYFSATYDCPRVSHRICTRGIIDADAKKEMKKKCDVYIRAWLYVCSVPFCFFVLGPFFGYLLFINNIE